VAAACSVRRDAERARVPAVASRCRSRSSCRPT